MKIENKVRKTITGKRRSLQNYNLQELRKMNSVAARGYKTDVQGVKNGVKISGSHKIILVMSSYLDSIFEILASEFY